MALELTDLAVTNLLANGLVDVIERHRGGLPWALGAAIGHIESEHEPHAYNYYLAGADGKKHLHRGVWDGQLDMLPDGTAGKPNAWAAGWLQIIRPYPRGLTLEQRFDAEAEARVLFPEWQKFYARSQDAGLDGRDLWAAVYFGHNQGAGRLKAGLPHAAKGLVSIINNSGLTEASAAQGALVVALHVASLVPQYAALEAQLKAASTS